MSEIRFFFTGGSCSFSFQIDGWTKCKMCKEKTDFNDLFGGSCFFLFFSLNNNNHQVCVVQLEEPDSFFPFWSGSIFSYLEQVGNEITPIIDVNLLPIESDYHHN